MKQVFETVIGLEVHAQLKTASKIFCSCSTRYGAEPNTQTCPVCLGMPGALPVLNTAAVDRTVKAGLALGCTIREFSHTARKNYFYPDLSKGYQISQFDEPLCAQGRLDFEYSGETHRVGITRIHIEEDAGKSLHNYGGGTAVDFNRCGVGLMEIVSEPEMHSPGEARAYLVKLKQILEYLDVSDCNMEEGSLRVDANLSLRPAGASELGVKTEVKNMNSFRSVERALAFEVKRQTDILSAGGVVEQVTLLWNDARGESVPIRSKEQAHDYRYFPEPDLVPIHLAEESIQLARDQLPELAESIELRFVEDYKLSKESAHILASQNEIAAFFDSAISAGADIHLAANWIQNEVLRIMKEREITLDSMNLSPERLAEWVNQIASGTISQQTAKQLFPELLDNPADSVGKLIEDSGLTQNSDTASLELLIQTILAEHPTELERYKSGEKKLIGFFMGQVMRSSGGTANPALVQKLLQKML